MTLWQWGPIALATLAVLFAASVATLALIKRKASRLARHEQAEFHGDSETRISVLGRGTPFHGTTEEVSG